MCTGNLGILFCEVSESLVHLSSMYIDLEAFLMPSGNWPFVVDVANMFSHHMTCLFTVNESFDKQEWLILLNSCVSVFTLWLVFFVSLNKSLPTSRLQNCFLRYLWNS